MRAGLSTIQQTLTPEAANVLNHSIAEAGRRNHGQTTPLHVAATLLASPSGFLRQACIKSHPNSSHPLQCRALELCFSVALERLPTAQSMNPGMDPPISNALMAALKRAQAHQRRGCPEQQQQPLLAVKVELEQLIISILDDPSVSRVMREARFSSPAVKTTIEQSLNTACSVSNSSPIGLGFRSSTRNLYMNPRLQQSGGAQSGQPRSEEVKKVMDILVRSKKKNPVLVGESEPEMVVNELLTKIESKELDGVLKNVEIIRLDKEFTSDKAGIVSKLKDLNALIESKIAQEGVILDLGDLKWLVEQQVSLGVKNSGAIQHQQKAVAEVVVEMGKMVVKFDGARLWLIGTATCETYLRCQVYHPSMENDWDLQAVPIAAKAPLSGMFPRLASNGILSRSVESLAPLKSFQTTATAPPRRVSENLDPSKKMSCCLQCMQNYERELTKLSKEFERSSSEVISEVAKPPLPQWLHNANKSNDDDDKTVDQRQTKDQDLLLKEKSEDLQKKWNDTCLNLHPSFRKPGLGTERIVPSPPSVTGLINPNLLARRPFQSKLPLNRNVGDALQLNPNLVTSLPSERTVSPPSSPVRTDLVLGQPKIVESTPEKTHKERVKDFLGCISSEPQNKLTELQSNKLHETLDGADSFKRLLKGLMDEVWWQQEAASAVATTVTQCKLGYGKRRGASKGDTWLLFTGPDEVGKKKMASALSELVYGANPITITLGSRCENGEPEVRLRGKTLLDRIVDAVRRNPFSVILLEDIDEADMVVRGNIKRAMERGRLTDSYGREISLGNVMFILTANWLPDSLKFLSHSITLDEKKLTSLASGGWQLRLSLSGKEVKRRASWLQDEERPVKPKKETGSALLFDLNKAADIGDDKDGSHNSSDLTVDYEEEHGLNYRLLMTASTSPPSRELLNSVDGAIAFKPVDFGPIRRNITSSITKKFSTIIGTGLPIEILDEALEKILSGVWLGRTGLEEWTEKVLVPSLHQLKLRLPTNVGPTTEESTIVRLELDDDSVSRSPGELLPSSIRVMVDGF